MTREESAYRVKHSGRQEVPTYSNSDNTGDSSFIQSRCWINLTISNCYFFQILPASALVNRKESYEGADILVHIPHLCIGSHYVVQLPRVSLAVEKH